MKNKTTLLFILSFVLWITIPSCKKDDNSSSGPSLSATITTGTWYISYFLESSDDHTADFSGYVFTFSPGGQLTATHSGTTSTGTWSLDDSSNKLKLNIGSVFPLTKVSDDWLLLENSVSRIKLKDDNSARNDELHFSRN